MRLSAIGRTADLVTHVDRVGRILADPTLTGDLQTVAIVLARMIDLRPARAARTFAQAATAAFPCPPDQHGPAWVAQANKRFRSVLAADAPRYEPPPASGRCAAPVADRNHPSPLCDVATDTGGITVTDPATGEVEHLQACPRHAGWLRSLAQAHRDQWRQRGNAAVPDPKPNSGGTLARHLPELPWPSIWAELRTEVADRTVPLPPVPPIPAPPSVRPSSPTWSDTGRHGRLRRGALTGITGGGESTPPRRGHLRLVDNPTPRT